MTFYLYIIKSQNKRGFKHPYLVWHAYYIVKYKLRIHINFIQDQSVIREVSFSTVKITSIISES
jgi:hypothetical protein